MKSITKFLIVGFAYSGLLLAPAFSQGFMGIANNYDFDEPTPFTTTVGVEYGWDKISYDSSAYSPNEFDSSYVRGGIGVVYAWTNRRTSFNMGADFSIIHYFDKTFEGDSDFYNARISLGFSHQVNPRLTISDQFYLAYEIEPDYGVGASRGTRQGQYVYGHNNFSVSYAWSERFSTVTSAAVSGIVYDDFSTEDRMNYLFSQQFRFISSPRLTTVAEYRFGYTDFSDLDSDNWSHYALAGFDYAWSERTTANIRVGAEFRMSDTSDEVAPYLEAGIRHQLTKKTDVRWYNVLGYDNSELGTTFSNRYSYRTGIVATHSLTERLTGSAGIHYVYSQFDGGNVNPDIDEQSVDLSVGLAYRVLENLSLTASYGYTMVNSDDIARDYDRHRIGVGLESSF